MFPGYHAALPVLGPAAVILAGALPSGETTIGDWSFSLHLGHWPLLILPEIVLQRELTWPERGLAIAGAFVMAFVSFRIVEAPFHEGALGRPPRRALTFDLVSIALVGTIAVGGTVYADFQATRGITCRASTHPSSSSRWPAGWGSARLGVARPDRPGGPLATKRERPSWVQRSLSAGRPR